MTLEGIKRWVIDKSTKESPTVPGYGSDTAKIVLVGECPGKNEVLEQRPFVGRCGKILRKALNAAGFSDEDIEKDIYITNAIKEWLPIGKTPPTSKIIYWHRMLMVELSLIKPTMVIAVGRTAFRSLGKNADLYVVHPGSIRFNKDNYKKLVDSFKKVKNELSNR